MWTGLMCRWTKEDHEIFDLVSALESAEGESLPLTVLLDATRREARRVPARTDEWSRWSTAKLTQ
jgi:hypothetical protein